MAVGNRFPSPDMSRGYPTQFADPFAQYADRGFSPLTENPYVPGQGGPARPNLLDSPSSFDSLAFGTSNPPQVIAQPSRQPGGKSQVKAGQARKAPFYSLQDRLDFLGRVYRVAKPVSEATGLSLPFILAHAAHEVQFGKNIRENNLFNLKADKDWQGSTHLKGGNEYRSYPSYEESMKDYLGYLQANPRYGKMFEPVTRGSLGRLVDAIHYAGYSDDPLYGFRILAAAKDPIMKQALWQYQHWPPGDTPL
jgi:flagellum-specific peptidoglycan hydrolase FlgJ